MQNLSAQKLIRIGVFYDGNYFMKVSNFYKFNHSQKTRISITGLHHFIQKHTAKLESVDPAYCRIVDAHFFRSRFSAKSADERQQLYNDRVLDDILMGEGVITHFLPMRNGGEKGIDVWLALEAYELNGYKKFDVIVLLTGDGDFVPLARKLNSLGTRVMVLGWNLSYMDHLNQQQDTITSTHLLDEVTYPVMMNELIDDEENDDNWICKELFIDPKDDRHLSQPLRSPAHNAVQTTPVNDKRYQGVIYSARDGFGFIKSEAFPMNIFFHWTNLIDREFDNITVGMSVSFLEGSSEKGTIALEVKTKDIDATEPE